MSTLDTREHVMNNAEIAEFKLHMSKFLSMVNDTNFPLEPGHVDALYMLKNISTDYICTRKRASVLRSLPHLISPFGIEGDIGVQVSEANLHCRVAVDIVHEVCDRGEREPKAAVAPHRPEPVFVGF